MPRAPEARLDLAACYEALKERARAVETLRRAAGLRPGDPEAAAAAVGSAPAPGRVAQRGRGAAGVGGAPARRRRARGAAPAHRFDPARSRAATRRARRQRSGAPPSSIRWATERARWSRCTTPPAIARGALDTVDARGRRRPARAGGGSAGRAAAANGWRELLDDGAQPRLERADRGGARRRSRASCELVTGQDAADGAGRHAPARSRPKAARAFWAELAHPAAGGFAGELWPNLVEAAMELFSAAVRRASGSAIRPGAAAALRLDRDQRHRAGRRPGCTSSWRASRAPPVVAARGAGARCCCWRRRREFARRRASTSAARWACSCSARPCSNASSADDARAAVRVRGDCSRASRRPPGCPQAVGRAAAHGDARASAASRGRRWRCRRRASRSRRSISPPGTRRAAHGGSAGPDDGRRRRAVGAGAGGRRAARRAAPHRRPSVATNPAALDLLRFALGEQYRAATAREAPCALMAGPAQAARPRMGSDVRRRRDLRRDADRAARESRPLPESDDDGGGRRGSTTME